MGQQSYDEMLQEVQIVTVNRKTLLQTKDYVPLFILPSIPEIECWVLMNKNSNTEIATV